MWPFFILVGLILIFVIVIYNAFIAAKKNTEEAWSDIEVQLKRRHDLIPQLVNTVKGYAVHEKDLLERITKERSDAINAQGKDIGHLASAENALEDTLKSLFMVAEAYPDLKADTNYLKLQEALSETEDQIASSRRIYNSNTADYNTRIALFPHNIVATVFRFKEVPFFRGEEKDKARPAMQHP